MPAKKLNKAWKPSFFNFQWMNGSEYWLSVAITVIQKSSVQSLSRVRLFAIPWTAARHAPCPSRTPAVHPNPCPLSRWCHPTISSSVVPFSSLPSIFPSIRVFSNESALHIRWPKYWSFSFSISPSNEHPGLISFRMDWLNLLAVQGTLKSLLQHHSSKASIFRHSAFFTVQLSHPYMTTGKTIALTRWTFVGKVMSLLFNMLSRLVIPVLPRSKHLLISWLQSPSAVILKPRKIKSVTVSTVYTKKRQTYYLPTAESIYHHSWSTVAKIISPWKLGPNLPSHQKQLKTGYKITKPFFKTLEISKWTTVISDRQETKWVLCLPQFTT